MSNLLTINGGSSSIRFALFRAAAAPVLLWSGKIQRIGSAQATLTAGAAGQPQHTTQVAAPSPRAAAQVLANWLSENASADAPQAIGHRIVHGMQHMDPQAVTPQLLRELKSLVSYDPDHLPGELELLETLHAQYPQVPQVVCFDTAFHRDMPRVARLLPIPLRFASQGIHRYGFHGLSYTYLMDELRRLGDPAASRGRVILAHLGSGASLAAVLDGRSIDTSMGFTPTAGLPMGTRSGDLDPGLMLYLARSGLNSEQLSSLVNHDSGLLGVSEISADVRDLLERENDDVRARDALALFCYQVKKWIGAFSAALGGVDTLVFAGGVGENAPAIRSRVCDGLQYLGITVDAGRNARSADLICTDAAAVRVRVIRTDEAAVIARLTAQTLQMQ